MKAYVRERKDEDRDRRSSLSALLSTRLPHQVEEDVPKVSPVVIGLGTVGPRGAHHVSEDPSVDVEVLEVEGEGELSEKSTTRRESQGKWGQRGKPAVNVCVCGGAMGRCWRKCYFKRRGRRRARKSDFFLSGALWVWANVGL